MGHLVVEAKGQVRTQESCLNSRGHKEGGHLSSLNYVPRPVCLPKPTPLRSESLCVLESSR